VRNRGTIGGSVALNDPSADYPAAIVALNATIHTDRRAIAADAMFTGMFETALEADELITRISIPIPEASGYAKFTQSSSHYPVAGVMVAKTAGGVRVAVTGAGPRVFRVPEMEAALAADFSAAALEGIEVPAEGLNADMHASAPYRAHLITVMARRAVTTATRTPGGLGAGHHGIGRPALGGQHREGAIALTGIAPANEIGVRESLPGDISSIETLYLDAFPDENLLPLVRDLLSQEAIVLSLIGLADEALVGHVVFTSCGIAGRTDKVALLGPLAVAPNWRRQGIGGSLVGEGFRRLKSEGVAQVYVLGDPAYYGRLGFKSDHSVSPPYPLPEEWLGAWQSISLRGARPPLSGKLSLPRPWLNPALWAP
jgi:predicted N-acetyltransferase YhbS